MNLDTQTQKITSREMNNMHAELKRDVRFHTLAGNSALVCD
jgi:hypothetical protein